jgi:hypothetical protein
MTRRGDMGVSCCGAMAGSCFCGVTPLAYGEPGYRTWQHAAELVDQIAEDLDIDHSDVQVSESDVSFTVSSVSAGYNKEIRFKTGEKGG